MHTELTLLIFITISFVSSHAFDIYFNITVKTLKVKRLERFRFL